MHQIFGLSDISCDGVDEALLEASGALPHPSRKRAVELNPPSSLEGLQGKQPIRTQEGQIKGAAETACQSVFCWLELEDFRRCSWLAKGKCSTMDSSVLSWVNGGRKSFWQAAGSELR